MAKRCKVSKFKVQDSKADTWLDWLADEDHDAYLHLKRAVHVTNFSSVLRKVPRPLRFTRLLEQETRWMREQPEVSVWYLRWLSRRHAQLKPWGTARNRFPTKQVYGLSGCFCSSCRPTKDSLMWIAQCNNIRLAKSWTKARMWKELLRAGATAEPRFQTYLTHQVTDGRVETYAKHC